MRAPAAKSVVDASVQQSTAPDIKLMAAAASNIHGHWHDQRGFLVPQCGLIPDVQWHAPGRLDQSFFHRFRAAHK